MSNDESNPDLNLVQSDHDNDQSSSEKDSTDEWEMDTRNLTPLSTEPFLNVQTHKPFNPNPNPNP